MPIGFDDGGFGDTRPPGRGLPPDGFEEALRDSVAMIPWSRWLTAADERVCPECGPLDGLVWPDGEGPVPPLHNNCRCRREFAFFEWSSREIVRVP